MTSLATSDARTPCLQVRLTRAVSHLSVPSPAVMVVTLSTPSHVVTASSTVPTKTVPTSPSYPALTITGASRSIFLSVSSLRLKRRILPTWTDPLPKGRSNSIVSGGDLKTIPAICTSETLPNIVIAITLPAPLSKDAHRRRNPLCRRGHALQPCLLPRPSRLADGRPRYRSEGQRHTQQVCPAQSGCLLRRKRLSYKSLLLSYSALQPPIIHPPLGTENAGESQHQCLRVACGLAPSTLLPPLRRTCQTGDLAQQAMMLQFPRRCPQPAVAAG